MMKDYDVDRSIESAKRYRNSPKGRKAIAKANKKINQQRKRITICFSGDELATYEIFLKLKGKDSINRTALKAIKEWLLRNG